ncbi:hypothetical protein CAPTEDRAFT_182979 [Capitella teleta]|uniref:Exocyst complex component 5 n=1 Tax=Capitella teleta TaxID=283909 RepID=R7V2S8_CAPTE|nr:hypothetical protein CAPTEDRAFT_182979 [Capitella teleta]|eukprot:ELU10626.1 hypothetical protein CAPTEDRAFT_182979 [Capitella teleta]
MSPQSTPRQSENIILQDPFDADEFVERLAWRTMGGHSRKNQDNFDPVLLHSSFERTIKDLKDLNIQVQKMVEKSEETCRDEERAHWTRVAELQRNNQAAFQHFQGLDERINFVATKVVHLGEQLEGVNTPRTRAAEAQKLMKYFAEFCEEDRPKSYLFTDPFQVEEAADIIQKLYLIAQELPIGKKFDRARSQILMKYDEIERQLIAGFKQALFDGDKRRMQKLATTLSQFKGYHRCIEIFIEESQKGAYTKPDIYLDIPSLVKHSHALATDVFTNPDAVMSKFLLNVYQSKLQVFVGHKLADRSDKEKYLTVLNDLHSKTTSLSNELVAMKAGCDASFLSKITKQIFGKYLDTYIYDEVNFLREKSSFVLTRFYDSKRHQKKAISSGGIHDLRRDLQAVIGAKANLNLGPTIENYGGETFLSQEVAINLLQESKLAFKRCQNLSARSDLPSNAFMIFDILVQYLLVEHMEYAVDLGLQAIPLADPKTEPEIYFFEVVEQANSIFHLFEKQFSDSLVPCVIGSPKHSECVLKKRDIMETMENRLDQGLDRTLSAMSGWVKHILITEQKKTDFKPENEDMQMYSDACAHVVKYVKTQVETIHNLLDGKNVDAALTEFGVRLHRVITEHLQQFQFNSMGAMLAICDVNEYRKCVKAFEIPSLNQIFDTLHSLCNLLVVVPEHLKEVCTGEQLASMDKSVLLSFVSLRSDFKTARLANYFK